MQEIEDQIRTMIARIVEKEESEIKPEDHIFRDLGADSMSALELMATLEKHFKIVINPADIQNLVTLSGATSLVNKYLEQKA